MRVMWRVSSSQSPKLCNTLCIQVNGDALIFGLLSLGFAMITPNGTLIEVYENRNNGTTLKIETDPDGHQGGWLAMDNCDIDYLIEELQKHKQRLERNKK